MSSSAVIDLCLSPLPITSHGSEMEIPLLVLQLQWDNPLLLPMLKALEVTPLGGHQPLPLTPPLDREHPRAFQSLIWQHWGHPPLVPACWNPSWDGRHLGMGGSSMAGEPAAPHVGANGLLAN